jgi:UDPglucose 6-dehydrogenase
MSRPRVRIAVVGSWHQSSVLCACFAEMGYDVVGVAGQPALDGLRAGRAPVHEPGLDELIDRMTKAGRLRFTDSFSEGLSGAEIAFVSIDTPVGLDDDCDLEPIWRAVAEISSVARDGLVVVVTSQVPVGTTEEIAGRLGSHIQVAYVPEFLRLGTALETFRNADRFVIGVDDPEVAARLAAIYQPLGRPVHVSDVRSAEMAKHASNAWLATSVSFINQIADLCEQVGADVTEVAAIMKLDRRVGPSAFLNAGVGYAGGTLGREIRALQNLGVSRGVPTDLFDAVEAVNRRRLTHVMNKVRAIQPVLADVSIAVFGLTYKAGTSTLRRSTSLTLIGELTRAGARVSAYDPLARVDEAGDLRQFTLHREPAEAIRNSSALILMTRWPDELAPQQAVELMARPVVVDTGNHLDPHAAKEAGLEYCGIGR